MLRKLFLALFIVTLYGCGGDSDTSETDPPTCRNNQTRCDQNNAIQVCASEQWEVYHNCMPDEQCRMVEGSALCVIAGETPSTSTPTPTDTAMGNDSSVNTSEGTGGHATDSTPVNPTSAGSDTHLVPDTNATNDTQEPVDTSQNTQSPQDTDTDTVVGGDTGTTAVLSSDTFTPIDTAIAHETDLPDASDTASAADIPTDTAAFTETPTDMDRGLNLIPDEAGWISGDSNALNLQGAWWTAKGLASSITMTISSAGTVCVEGYSSEVPDIDEWPDYWGTMVAFDLCGLPTVEGEDDHERHPVGDCPFNSNLVNQLAGISFDLEGSWDTSDDYLRVQFKEAGEDENTPYVNVDDTGTNSADMEDAYVWYKDNEGYDAYDYPSEPEEVESIQFVVHANLDDDSYFDFCISNVQIRLH